MTPNPPFKRKVELRDVIGRWIMIYTGYGKTPFSRQRNRNDTHKAMISEFGSFPK